MMKQKNKNWNIAKKVPMPEYSDRYSLDGSLEHDLNIFGEIFRDDDTLITRQFQNEQDKTLKCCVIFLDGMVKNEIINESIIKPVISAAINADRQQTLRDIMDFVIEANDVEISFEIGKLIDALVRGDTVFLADGCAQGLVINTRNLQTRAIEEPPTERTILGPREGLIESLQTNIALIRRKLATPDLKFKLITLGERSNTKICICYLDSIVNRKILQEVLNRLDGIYTDSILDTEYIRDYIRDYPFSPFLTTSYTERPEVVAANILEGRVAVLADGSPVALTVPYLFIENFQASEDYFITFRLASINRLLRIAGFWISISLPGVYTSLVTYHQEAIPTPLLLSISSARQGVPFPSIIEVIIMMVIFEMLRDAGVRMPSNLGQALSIVGALVLGSASVEAKIVSAPIVIVVSVSAITGLMVPKLTGAVVELRLILLLLSALLGLYGYIFGFMGIMIYLCSMCPFGVPYMLQISSLEAYDMKDTTIKAPAWYLKNRPKLISFNRMRAGRGGRKTWSGKQPQ